MNARGTPSGSPIVHPGPLAWIAAKIVGRRAPKHTGRSRWGIR